MVDLPWALWQLEARSPESFKRKIMFFSVTCLRVKKWYCRSVDLQDRLRSIYELNIWFMFTGAKGLSNINNIYLTTCLEFCLRIEFYYKVKKLVIYIQAFLEVNISDNYDK